MARASLAESSATNFKNKTGIRDFADTVVRSNAEIALLGTISLKGLVVRAVSIFVVVESRKVLQNLLKSMFANLLSLHNGRGEHYTLNRRYPSSFINLMKTFNRYSHFAVKLFVCDISVFFFRVHDNESCNLIGSLRGPYFPISAHEQR